jgi:DMSO reductase family type II enzyme chaperone
MVGSMMAAGGRASTPAAMMSRAALFRLLALGFAYPAPGHASEMRKTFFQLGAAVRRGLFSPSLARSIGAAQRVVSAAGDAALAAEYLRLFSGRGAVSLHEAAYGDGRRIAGRPAELADISGFYLAFGVSASDGDPDLPDHLSAELEFLSLLLLKESHATLRGWRAKSRIARDAAKAFLEDHLGRWVGAFARDLARADASPSYQALARLVCSAVDSECRRLGARPRLIVERLPADPMQAENFACPLSAATAKPA